MAEFVMPSLGADMTAGTLAKWRVAPGDPISQGDIIAEVETDKGLIEVEVFDTGVVERLLVEEGAKVPVGTPLAEIGAGGAEAAAPRKADAERPPRGSGASASPVATESLYGVSASVPMPVIATESATESEPESASGPPSRPPAGVFSKSAGRFEEPFPTRTMARILAQQGHFKRSLAIYGALLRDEPGNRDLSAEVEEVRTQSRTRRSLAR